MPTNLTPTIFADIESGPAVWVRVEGKGTFQNSPGLKEFSGRMMEEGRRDFIVDLKDCPTMDSTFMGALAGLALRLREVGEGRLWVVNRNQRNSELLEGLGIDMLFSEEPVPATTGVNANRVVEHATDKESIREMMREAHETCIRVNPANEARFRDVIEHLRTGQRH